MPSTNLSKVDPLALTEWYFTPKDLNVFESALIQAMTDLELAGAFIKEDNEDARHRTRLRLAAAIMRRASIGERNPITLKRAALQALA